MGFLRGKGKYEQNINFLIKIICILCHFVFNACLQCGDGYGVPSCTVAESFLSVLLQTWVATINMCGDPFFSLYDPEGASL